MSQVVTADAAATPAELHARAAEDYAATQVDHEKQDHRDDAHHVAPDSIGGA